jgi:hypothetical protein
VMYCHQRTPEDMVIILAILGSLKQEAKIMASQEGISMKRGLQGPISDHKIQSHSIEHQVFKILALLLAVNLLLNLEAARQGRSMLFSDEQKLLFKGGKKGFAKNTTLDFMRC